MFLSIIIIILFTVKDTVNVFSLLYILQLLLFCYCKKVPTQIIPIGVDNIIKINSN